MYCYTRKERTGLSLIAAALLLGGCAGAPKNAEDFRQMAREAAPYHLKIIENLEVARPFRDVSSTLRQKTDECLRVKLTREGTYRHTDFTMTHTYKPTFIATANKAELHVQLKMEGTRSYEFGAPPDGSYRVVLDATPAGPNKTKIVMYVNSIDDNLIRNAMRGWVQGTNLGCPDVSKR